VLEEQRAIRAKHGDALTFEALNEMEYLHACIKVPLLSPFLHLLINSAKCVSRIHLMQRTGSSPSGTAADLPHAQDDG
jgi:hypothetical protein